MKNLFIISIFLLAYTPVILAQNDHNHDHHGHDHNHDHGHDHNHGVNAEPAKEQSSFKWNESVHDFGKIKQGVPVSTEFIFTNIGKEPIIISNAKASCGCTVPEYSKDPVPPGKTGTLKATYNAANPGFFEKEITVYSNASAVDIKLKVKGEVIAE